MKVLPSENYIIRPFRTHKTFRETFVYDTFNATQSFQVGEAIQPPPHWQWGQPSESVNPNGLYKRPLYSTTQHVFYNPLHSWFQGPEYNLGFDLKSEETCFIFTVPQQCYGEGIRPGTVTLSSPAGTGSISDDGLGRLRIGPEVVGNIFYNVGIGVLKKTNELGNITGSVIVHDGVSLKAGNAITIQYDATHTIYEHMIMCTIESTELNYSMNPSMSGTSSFATASLMQAMASGSLTPYVTTIGLYDEVGDLVAVAKTPRPVRRAPDVEQTFIIKLDL